jgi:hypothetical protein
MQAIVPYVSMQETMYETSVEINSIYVVPYVRKYTIASHQDLS